MFATGALRTTLGFFLGVFLYRFRADLSKYIILFPVAVLIAATNRRSPLERILLLLGSASYPIYVLHRPLGSLIHNIFGARIELFAPWSGYLLAAFLVTLSVLLERHYDIPVRRSLSAMVLGRKRRPDGSIVVLGASLDLSDTPNTKPPKPTEPNWN